MILVELGDTLTKSLLDILSIFGTDFEISKTIFLLKKLLCFLIRNLSVFQVTFVSQYHKMKLVFWTQIGLGKKLIPPLDNLLESLSISQIEHQKTTVTSLVKDVQKCPELFLPSSVPNGVRVLNIINDHFVRKLICPDCYPVLTLKLLIDMAIDNRSFSDPF